MSERLNLRDSHIRRAIAIVGVLNCAYFFVEFTVALNLNRTGAHPMSLPTCSNESLYAPCSAVPINRQHTLLSRSSSYSGNRSCTCA